MQQHTAYNNCYPNSLECRTEEQLASLRANGYYMTVHAPVTWEDWVNVFTTSFAPANRISLPHVARGNYWHPVKTSPTYLTHSGQSISRSITTSTHSLPHLFLDDGRWAPRIQKRCTGLGPRFYGTREQLQSIRMASPIQSHVATNSWRELP